MGFFGTKKTDEKGAEMPASEKSIAPPPVASRPSGPAPTPVAPGVAAAVGIDHAIGLMRTLPTDKNVDLVVTVLKTTLESLGIRVADIVADAGKRQQDIEARVAQLKAEIVALEKEMDLRVKEITRLEAAHAETTKVKQYLQGGNHAAVPQLLAVSDELDEEIEVPSEQ